MARSSDAFARWRSDPIKFIETVLYDPETARPFVLMPFQREFLKHSFKTGPDGRLLYQEQVLGAPKKTGKTEFAAMHKLTTILLFGGMHAEGYALANDEEQAGARVFKAVRRIVEASPLLAREAEMTRDTIIFPAFHSATITTLATKNYASAAGSNPTHSSFDELWGYTSENERRLFDEMVPPPTRKIACRLTVSYAGWVGESALLEGLYRRGLQQPQVGPDLHAGDGILMYWTHDLQAPWQTEKWRDEMRRSLRPNQYLRMVENRWTSSESSFVELAVVESCLGNYHELAPSPNISYFCCVDPAGGSGEDSFAAAIVHRDGTQVITDAVREWVPPFQPDKVIADIAGLCRAYNIRTVYGDRFGDAFSASLFRQHNLIYEALKKSKSDQYSALLPMLNAKRIVLPRHDRLVRQIVGLERQVTRSGHDSIDHAPGARDDIANALAAAAQLAHTALPSLWPSESFLDNGRAAELPPPKRVLCMFAVIVAAADASQVGVAYFQGTWTPDGGLLYLVDALIAPPGAATLKSAHARFNEIFEQAPTCDVYGQQIFGNVPEVYCQQIIGDQLDVLLGRPVNTRPIDYLLASGDLALAAAMHIAKVRVTATVLEKYGLGFLDGTAGRDSDVLRTAVLTGIVAGFDADRLIAMNGPRRPSVNRNRR